jgi:hypothetical protein
MKINSFCYFWTHERAQLSWQPIAPKSQETGKFRALQLSSDLEHKTLET